MDQQPQLNSDPRMKKLLKKMQNLTWLRNASRFIMLFGFAASAAGNILHAEKNFVDIAIALAAPVFLFCAFEMLSRVPRRTNAHWAFKWLRISATGAIAGICAYLSYFHQRDAIFSRTGDLAQAALLPIAVDALMIVGSITLMELSIQLEELESRIDAIHSGQKVSAKVLAPPKVEKPLSKREIIVKAWQDYPEASIQKLADLTGASYNYVAGVLKDLRDSQQMETEPVNA